MTKAELIKEFDRLAGIVEDAQAYLSDIVDIKIDFESKIDNLKDRLDDIKAKLEDLPQDEEEITDGE